MAVNVPLVVINDLAESTSPLDTDCFIIGTTETKKIKLSTLVETLKNKYQIDDINNALKELQTSDSNMQTDISNLKTDISNLKTTVQKKQDTVKDTGWLKVTTFYNNCTSYSSDAPVMARQIGSIVCIKGVVKNTKQFTISGNKQAELFKLPSGISSTPTELNFIQQGSGANKFTLTLKTTGVVSLQRYGTTSNGNVPVNQWLNTNCTYFT